MTPDMSPEETLGSLVDVSTQMAGLAADLRLQDGVTSVAQPCWMRREQVGSDGRIEVGQGRGFRVEWYADAEFADGSALSLGLELSWSGVTWRVERSVRRSDHVGQHDLVDPQSTESASDSEMVEHLRQASASLVALFETALVLHESSCD